MDFEKYVVYITVQKKDLDLNHPLNVFGNSQATGTGFYIDKGIILTCYHVVQNSLDIMVNVYKNKENIKIKATIKYIFPDDDLAVIELEDKETDHIILDYEIIKNKTPNVEVNTIGFPLNSTTVKINKGIVSGYQDSNIQTDSTLNSGNSGGPLIINNKVIGINQSKMSGEASNTGYAVPIFRFLILYKLKMNSLKLINNKPNLLFKYQLNKQKFYNFDYGVRVSKIHNDSVLYKHNIEIDDLILKINNSKIDQEGKLQFSFFPEKIILNEIGLWFTVGDQLNITYYSHKNKKIIDDKIILSYTETNLLEYYTESKRQYNFENKGLVFSVFTNYHVDEIKQIDMSLHNKVKLLSRFLNINNKFTVYLSDLIHSKLKFIEYPINEIITHINSKELVSYDVLVNVMKEPITSFITVDNSIYYV